MKKRLKILFATGGTGGHVFPALALAEKMHKDHTLFLITDPRGEKYVSPEAKKYFQKIKVLPLTHFGGGIIHKIKGLFYFGLVGLSMPFRLWQMNPDKIIGFGGFLSFWPLAWGALLRKKTLLYQPDALMGSTNRLLQQFAGRIATGFAQTHELKKPSALVGLVTRSAFQPSPYPKRSIKDPLQLLVLGGSQGAEIFNQVLPQAIKILPKMLQEKMHVHQQCRAGSEQTLKQSYPPSLHLTITPFITDVAAAITKAHLVISRAGTSTLGEIATIGRPAFLVPYPHAKGDHQYYNAKVFEENGSVFLCLQRNFTPAALATALESVITHPERLEKMAKNIQDFSGQNACATLKKVLLDS